MKDIPIEFMPGFWVSLPQGLEGKGSGFLLAENIKSVFSVNCNIAKGNWSVIEMTDVEVNRDSYLDAFIRLISESWLDTKSIIIIGQEPSIRQILVRYLSTVGGINREISPKVVISKLG